MACNKISCLCNHIVISQNVSFTDNQLVIDLPAGSYENGEKYCLVVAQPIPAETTIAADAVISIGGNTDTVYPLVNANCSNVQAYQVTTRTKYPTIVSTNIGEGVFKLLSNLSCIRCNNSVAAIPITNVEQTSGGDNS